MTAGLDYFFSEPADYYGFLRMVATGAGGSRWDEFRPDGTDRSVLSPQSPRHRRVDRLPRD